MPYRFNILDVDNLDDERYNDPTENDDYLYFEDEELNSQHEVNCRMCGGTGEGMASGYSCSWCKGKGYIIKKH